MLDSKCVIIDVREPFEFADGHVEGAINIPSGDFLESSVIDSMKEELSDSIIILYCRTGARAGRCQKILEAEGFPEVINGINQKTVETMWGTA